MSENLHSDFLIVKDKKIGDGGFWICVVLMELGNVVCHVQTFGF